MGSFNVGCAVSNLTVHEGDEIGFMLLRPKAYRSEETTKHRIYATDDYEPFLPPIYGVYGDYGDLTDIRESNVTAAIEEIFRRPVEKVIEAVGSGRSYYDSYSPIYTLYMPKSVTSNKPEWNAHESKSFALLGWTRIDAPEGAVDAYSWRGYSAVKTHVRAVGPGMEAGTWTIRRGEEVLKEGFEASLNSPAEGVTAIFAELTGQLPGYLDEDWEAIKLLGTTYGMFFLKRVSDEMTKAVTDDRWNRSSFERTKEYLERDFAINVEERLEELAEMKKLGKYSHQLLESFRGIVERFPEIEKKLQLETRENAAIVQRTLTVDDLMESEALIATMTRLNRMVQPSYCGSQFGEDRLSMKLNSVTDAILAERAKDWEDEDEEDED